MTAASLSSARPFSLIAKKHRDGSVLLSAANDRVFKLNGVGSLTWSVLEQSSAALSIGELVQELCAEFAVINAGGEMKYDVSQEQLKVDTTRFIRSLAENGLLEVVSGASGQDCYRIKEDVSGTTSTTLAELSNDGGETAFSTSVSSATSLSGADRVQNLAAETIRPRKRETLTAFFGLFSFDLLLRFRGFEALIRKVERWPTAAARTKAWSCKRSRGLGGKAASASTAASASDAEICRRVCAMVNRAQVYYPRKAMCLQHSAVVTCLLRRQGVSAEMVLAAQEFPPKGHAWVEVNGIVVNDKPSVREIYRTLRRV